MGGAGGADCLFPNLQGMRKIMTNVIISKLAYKIYLFLVESWQSERDQITRVTLLFSGLSLCTLPLK